MVFMGSTVLYPLHDNNPSATFLLLAFLNYFLLHQSLLHGLKYISSKYGGVTFMGCHFRALQTVILLFESTVMLPLSAQKLLLSTENILIQCTQEVSKKKKKRWL